MDLKDSNNAAGDKKDFDLEGIIIEPAPGADDISNQTSADGSTIKSADGGDESGTVAQDLLAEGGIEILRNGKSVDLNDPDLM